MCPAAHRCALFAPRAIPPAPGPPHHCPPSAAPWLQRDVLLASSTVREALVTSALLKLPRALSTADKLARVDDIIQQLVRGGRQQCGVRVPWRLASLAKVHQINPSHPIHPTQWMSTLSHNAGPGGVPAHAHRG